MPTSGLGQLPPSFRSWPGVFRGAGDNKNFVFEGKACTVTETPNPMQNCIYEDKAVAKGVLYSYRVWTGGGPSPVASARAK